MKNIGQYIPQLEKRFDKAKKANGLGVAWFEESFTQIPNKVILDSSLSSTTFKVYVALSMHLFGKETCFPSQTLIAKEVGLKGKNGRICVNKHLKILEARGYIRKESRQGNCSTYTPLHTVRGP